MLLSGLVSELGQVNRDFAGVVFFIGFINHSSLYQSF